jgi:hypothetical protein
MKYLVLTMIATLLTAAVLPFIIQFAQWGAAWVRTKQTDMSEGSQEVSEAQLDAEETE